MIDLTNLEGGKIYVFSNPDALVAAAVVNGGIVNVMGLDHQRDYLIDQLLKKIPEREYQIINS